MNFMIGAVCHSLIWNPHDSVMQTRSLDNMIQDYDPRCYLEWVLGTEKKEKRGGRKKRAKDWGGEERSGVDLVREGREKRRCKGRERKGREGQSEEKGN